ncbi:MAG TPA: response regulator [Rhizomicrobium sp.]
MNATDNENHAVLIAEDEAMLRIVAVETLKDEGFTVFEAGDGVSALEELRNHPEIKLLISDIKMPRLGGYDLAKNALDLRPDLKVLFMTGYSTESPPDFVRARAIKTLQKPFNVIQLSHAAKTMLGIAPEV